MDTDNLWKKQVSEKNGKVYFVNTITSEIFETSVYETDSYIKIQTIDGQVQIPEDALIVLRQWSDTFDAFSRWKQNSIPNVNVSSSYLTRLISIARASFQYESLDPSLLKFQIRKQIYHMFNLHTEDKFTEFYDKEIGITDQMKEFFNELTGYNSYCKNMFDVVRNHYDDEYDSDDIDIKRIYDLVSIKDSMIIRDTGFWMFCKKKYNRSIYSIWSEPPKTEAIAELKRLWIILKRSTNEDEKDYVSRLESEEIKLLIEAKEENEKQIIIQLKYMWKNQLENEKYEIFFDEALKEKYSDDDFEKALQLSDL